MTPVVSVLMPVRDGEQYLESALKSLLCQSFEDFELVVVDDGSTDRTSSILADHAARDKRLRTLRNKISLGLTPSLSLALPQLRGEFVARQDADDLSKATRLERQVALLRSSKRLGLVGSFFEAIDASGRLEFWSSVPTNPDDVRARLLFESCFPHSTWMVRADLLAEHGYDPNYVVSQDYELAARLAATTDLSAVPEVLVSIRRGHDERVGATRGDEQRLLAGRVSRREAERVLGRAFREVEAASFSRFRAWLLGGASPRRLDVSVLDEFLRRWQSSRIQRRVWRTRCLQALRRMSVEDRPIARALARDLAPMLGYRARGLGWLWALRDLARGRR